MLEKLDVADLRRRLETDAELVNATVGRSYLRPGGQQLNAAFTDAIFVGLMEQLTPGNSPKQAALKERLVGLAKDEDLVEPTTRATADEETVKARLAIAREALAHV